MISNQIAQNFGGSQGLQRRMSPTVLARAPSQGETEGVSGEIKRSDSLSVNSSEPGVVRDRGLVGRVATVEWQQRINLSYSVGVADRAMGEIDEKVNEAKRDLVEMTKMFPPYPHGSEERVALLNSYRSLRMQIDKLTIPPESEIAAKILGGSESVGEDGLPVELQGFQVDAGKEGLDLLIPSVLVNEMEDDEFGPVIDNLNRAAALLQERRMSLHDTISAIFNQDGGDEALYVKLSLELKEQLSAFDATMGREKTGLHNDFPLD
ncbi:MAG: hypothetical protein J7L57_00810 [Deltaproteobacteria bacterium]|nr:hypothetical protein [Candidatus Tharpella sp.]